MKAIIAVKVSVLVHRHQQFCTGGVKQAASPQPAGWQHSTVPAFRLGLHSWHSPDAETTYLPFCQADDQQLSVNLKGAETIRFLL